MNEVNQNIRDSKVKGVRIRVVNAVMVFLMALVAIIQIMAVTETSREYRALEDAGNHYIAAAQASNDMKEASNYLTIQARTFAATQEPRYLERYFNETSVQQRREKAIQVIQDNILPNDTESEGYLDQALEQSRELMEREYYAMKLVVDARGIALDEQSADLESVELTPEDSALSPDKKVALATSMLYDEVYAGQVDEIEADVTACKRSLVDSFERAQAENSVVIRSLLLRQQVLTVAMLILTILFVLFIVFCLLRPIMRYIAHINANEPLSLEGAYELRFLAKAYNTMYDENLRSRNQLQRRAEHDHLTGLYNRAGFEKLLNACHNESIALLLIDADYFKNINDTLGHDGGDAMLQKIGTQLSNAFRSSDYPCRIGGDEFAVIMTDVDPSLKHVVQQKIDQVAIAMRDTSDGLPEMTLSIGVAFSDGGMEGDVLFKHADTALYQVKEAGRNGSAFYAG